MSSLSGGGARAGPPKRRWPTPRSAYEPDRVLAIGFDEALRLLQKLDRDVYLLREQGGLTYEEVAALCGIAPRNQAAAIVLIAL